MPLLPLPPELLELREGGWDEDAEVAVAFEG